MSTYPEAHILLHMVVTAAVSRSSSGTCSIQATQGAFAAVLGNGSVVTWGSPKHGGDSSSVQEQLSSVHTEATHPVSAAAMHSQSSMT